ncbi:hypothetical protein U0070_017689, partial [Myodes glareolus]
PASITRRWRSDWRKAHFWNEEGRVTPRVSRGSFSPPPAQRPPTSPHPHRFPRPGRSQPPSEPHHHWLMITPVKAARPATGHPRCAPAPPPPPSRLSRAPYPARPAASSRSSWAGTALGLFKVCESLHNPSIQLNVLSEPSGRCSPPPAAPALGAPLSMAGWLYSSRCALLPHLASRGKFPTASLCPQAAAAWARPRAASCRLRSSPCAPSSPVPAVPPTVSPSPGRLSSAGQRQSTGGLGRSRRPHPAPPPTPPLSHSSGSRSRNEGRADRRPLPAAVRPARELDTAPTSSRKISLEDKKVCSKHWSRPQCDTRLQCVSVRIQLLISKNRSRTQLSSRDPALTKFSKLEEFCARLYSRREAHVLQCPVVGIYERKKSPFCKDASLSESHGPGAAAAEVIVVLTEENRLGTCEPWTGLWRWDGRMDGVRAEDGAVEVGWTDGQSESRGKGLWRWDWMHCLTEGCGEFFIFLRLLGSTSCIEDIQQICVRLSITTLPTSDSWPHESAGDMGLGRDFGSMRYLERSDGERPRESCPSSLVPLPVTELGGSLTPSAVDILIVSRLLQLAVHNSEEQDKASCFSSYFVGRTPSQVRWWVPGHPEFGHTLGGSAGPAYRHTRGTEDVSQWKDSKRNISRGKRRTVQQRTVEAHVRDGGAAPARNHRPAERKKSREQHMPLKGRPMTASSNEVPSPEAFHFPVLPSNDDHYLVVIQRIETGECQSCQASACHSSKTTYNVSVMVLAAIVLSRRLFIAPNAAPVMQHPPKMNAGQIIQVTCTSCSEEAGQPAGGFVATSPTTLHDVAENCVYIVVVTIKENNVPVYRPLSLEDQERASYYKHFSQSHGADRENALRAGRLCGAAYLTTVTTQEFLDETKAGVSPWPGSELPLLCRISEVNFDGWKIDGCQMQFDIDSGSCSEASHETTELVVRAARESSTSELSPPSQGLSCPLTGCPERAEQQCSADQASPTPEATSMAGDLEPKSKGVTAANLVKGFCGDSHEVRMRLRGFLSQFSTCTAEQLLTLADRSVIWDHYATSRAFASSRGGKGLELQVYNEPGGRGRSKANLWWAEEERAGRTHGKWAVTAGAAYTAGDKKSHLAWHLEDPVSGVARTVVVEQETELRPEELHCPVCTQQCAMETGKWVPISSTRKTETSLSENPSSKKGFQKPESKVQKGKVKAISVKLVGRGRRLWLPVFTKPSFSLIGLLGPHIGCNSGLSGSKGTAW